MLALTPLPGKPLVSIIVPSYNQGRFIKETLNSILQQDYRPVEILVIDGASTDSTIDVLHQYDNVQEVKWISEPDNGVVEAVNKGFASASGQIIGIQSSDDCYLPEALEMAVEYLRKNMELGLVYGDTIKVNEKGEEIMRYRVGPFSIEGFLGTETWIPQPSAFFRAELLEELKGWDERYFVADTELWLRMMFRTKVEKIDEFMSVRRMHGEQRDKQSGKIADDYCRMIDESQDIAVSLGNIRKAAMASKHLIKLRYGKENDYIGRAGHLLAAGVLYPPSFNCRLFFKYLVYYPTRIALSRIKQFFIRAKTVAGMG